MAAEYLPTYELHLLSHQQVTPSTERDFEQDADKPPRYEEDPQRPPPYSPTAPPKPKERLTPEQRRWRRKIICLGVPLLLIVSLVAIIVAVIETRRSHTPGISLSTGSSGYSQPQQQPIIHPNVVYPNSSLATAELRGLEWQGIIIYQLSNGSIQHQLYRPQDATNTMVNISARSASSETPIQAIPMTGIACRTYGSGRSSNVQIVLVAENLTLVDWWLRDPGSNNTWRPGRLSANNFRVLEGSTCFSENRVGGDLSRCTARPRLTFEPERNLNALSNGTSVANDDHMVRLWGPGDDYRSLREYHYLPHEQIWSTKHSVLPNSYSLGGLAVQVKLTPARDAINTTIFHTNSSGLSRYERTDVVTNGTVDFSSKNWTEPRNTSIWPGSWAPLALVPVANSSDAWLYTRASDHNGKLLVARTNASDVRVVANLTALQSAGPVVDQYSDLVSGPWRNGGSVLLTELHDAHGEYLMHWISNANPDKFGLLCSNCTNLT